MKNRILFSVVMLSFALLVVIGSVMLIAGADMFAARSTGMVVSLQNKGSVTLIRRGASYELKDGISLKAGDEIKTAPNSHAQIAIGSNSIVTLDENSSFAIPECEDGNVCIEPIGGTTFFEVSFAGNMKSFNVMYSDAVFTASDNALFSFEVFNGTQTVNLYKGAASVRFSENLQSLFPGEQAVLLQDDDGISTIRFSKTNPKWLGGFLIEKLIHIQGVCFEREELREISRKREEETQAALAAQAAREQKIIEQGGTVPIISSKPVTTPSPPPTQEVFTCTIQICCDTILENMDKLNGGKSKYVPKNGVILDTAKVEFVKGDTVYDALKQACRHADIPIEYKWYVEYGGYYIEGINHLFEFDCGKGSGWMYKVNGWYPNYGCSNYKLKDKDVIVWNYTCDLGKDLGAEVR